MNLRVLVMSGAVAFVASLLLARVHPFGDAGLYAPARAQTQSSIPAPVAAILGSKCADCHSSQTRTPFYGRLAPISWLLERDIVKGREQLNLSAWDSYPPARQQLLQAKIIQQTKTHQMPLPQYRAIHWGSAVTTDDLNVLIGWVHTASLTEGSSGATEGSAAAGKIVFEKRCTGCHALEQDREGPRLRGVFGRRAGSVAGFAYSAALKQSRMVWDEVTLDKWLADPDAFVKDNNMDFHVPKAQERADLIGFLKETAAK